MVNRCKVALDISMKGRHQKKATTKRMVVTKASNLLVGSSQNSSNGMTASCAANNPM